MHPIADFDPLTSARALALFASDLPAHPHPDRAAVADAISRAIALHGGTGGCAGEAAAAYGDYPEIAVSRMRWARQVIEMAYPPTVAA